MTPGTRHIRIGYLSTLYHTSYILQGTGLLADQGITAGWTLFPSGPDMVTAIREDEIDLGYLGLPPAIIGIDHGTDIVCVAGGHIEGTLLVGREEWKSLDECRDISAFLTQFEGLSFGCPPRGSIHDVILTDLLGRTGTGSIQVKHYPWADFIPDALQGGEIAAAAGTPALAVSAMRYGGAKVLVWPSQAWPFNPSCGIIVQRDLCSDRDLLTRFIRVHEEACEQIRREPGRCARIVSQVTENVDPSFIEQVYAVSPRYCAALPREYRSSTMRFVDALYRAGYISRSVGEREIFDATIIDKVHCEPPHYYPPAGEA